MNLLESLASSSEDGIDAGKKFVKTSYNYNKLKAFKLLTYSLSSITKLFLLGTLFSVGIIFSAVAGAIAIGEYLNDLTLGYLSIGALFFTLGILIFLMRKIIDRQIIKKMSMQFFDSKK
jgi:hypothetical protein